MRENDEILEEGVGEGAYLDIVKPSLIAEQPVTVFILQLIPRDIKQCKDDSPELFSRKEAGVQTFADLSTPHSQMIQSVP